jgi:hypothetical protein
MALTKTLQPPNVVLGEDPVLFGFETNNLTQTPGVKAQFTLFLSAMPTVGQQFTLAFAGHEITFEFVANPGNDPAELPANYTGTGFGTFNAYLAQLKDELLKHYLVHKYYDVTVAGTQFNPYLLFVAKYPGTTYNITLTAINITTNQQLNVTGVNEVMRPCFWCISANLYR